MRKSSRGHSGEKLYINNSLCVNGEKIQILKPQGRKINTRCLFKPQPVRLDTVVSETEDEQNKHKTLGVTATRESKRTLLQPAVTNLEVCNKLLRQIYESVEVQDFERILKNSYVSSHFKNQKDNNKSKNSHDDDAILNLINPTEIYREHFARYYDTLKTVVEKSKSNNLAGEDKQKEPKMDCRIPPLPSVPPQIPSQELDRKVMRETLYSEIFQRHRKSIFALGSFLRMFKSKKSNYNVIKQDGESETE